MTETTELNAPVQPFVERRSAQSGDSPRGERRQFADSRDGLAPEVREFADAIDAYKLQHRRRFITVDEMFSVFVSLGYHR